MLATRRYANRGKVLDLHGAYFLMWSSLSGLLCDTQAAIMFIKKYASSLYQVCNFIID